MLHMPALPQVPLEPKPDTGNTLGEASSSRRSLLSSVRDLLQDGLEYLQSRWDGLASDKEELWQDGVKLQAGLADILEHGNVDDSAACDFVADCSHWYLGVRLMPSTDNGKVSPDELAALTEIQAEIDQYEQSASNGQPPDPRWWARILRKLADAVKTGFGLQRQRMDTLEARTVETFARIDARLDEMQEDIRELKAGQARLEENVAELKGTAEVHGQKLDEHGLKLDEHGQKLDEHGQKLDEHGQKLDEHGQKLDEHGQKLDEHGQKLDEHGQKLDEHGQKLDEHGQKLDEHGLKLDTLLRFTQGEAALRLEDGCREWGQAILPRLFKQLRPLRDAPTPQWQIQIRSVSDPWHDHLPFAEAQQAWSDLRLPDALNPEDVPCDLLMRIQYALPNEQVRDCLVVGEATRTVDPGRDVQRLGTWRRELERQAGLSVVPCLFASERSQARGIEEMSILHMVSADGRSWEEDPRFREKMARLLDLNLESASPRN